GIPQDRKPMRDRLSLVLRLACRNQRGGQEKRPESKNKPPTYSCPLACQRYAHLRSRTKRPPPRASDRSGYPFGSLNFLHWLRNWIGFWYTTLSTSSPLQPRRFISSAV